MKVHYFSSISSLIVLVLIICTPFLIIECKKSNGPEISVYSSSLDGDRFTKKPDTRFTWNNDSSVNTIYVDQETRYQKIEGFGATFNEAGMICLNSLSVNAQNNVLKELFDTVSGCGYNIMKSPMASCDFASAGPWYSYNDFPCDTNMAHFNISRDLGPNGLLTYIRKASKFGRFEIETTMDFAPDWMMFGLKPGKKHIKPEYYPALAKYYSNYLQSYAANGVTVKYLNPFNEPQNEWYSNVTYKEIGELIKNYIVKQFKADGLTTKIQLCETSNRPEAIEKLPAVLDDTVARKYINTITVHGYDWDKFSTLTELHNKYPDLPIWQTEVCYARVADLPTNEPPNGPAKLPVYNFSDGEFWGNMIMNDMKNWVSAWVYWNMILDQDGGPWLVSKEHGDPDNNRQHPIIIINRSNKEVSYTGLFYYLGHFSKFIKPGAYRINCTGGSQQLNFAGFLNIDGSIVLNIINNGDNANCKISWKNQTVNYKLKSHSITTLKWKSSAQAN
jgi:glucosylceramidase